MVHLRLERPADISSIHAVVAAAFAQEAEANLVDALRAAGLVRLSLVADDNGIVGHVLFSDVKVGTASALALAPVSVRPDRQRRGIGSMLIRDALARLREHGHGAVFVLGDPAYYSRFGFSAAAAKRFPCRYACEAFQALELQPGALATLSGEVVYPPAFDAV